LSEKKILNDTKNHWWMKPEYPEKTTDLPHWLQNYNSVQM
jgi:hypothetical protein